MKKVSNKNKMEAFTLAEVLITLAIIGIVAALTVPTVVTNYQKKETVTRLKKAYNILNEAVMLSQADTGIKIKDWNFDVDGIQFYNTYLKKYIKALNDSSYTDYQKNAKIIYLNGNKIIGDNWGIENPNKANYNAILPDGMIMVVEGWYSDKADFKIVAFDVNGEKKPNKVGRDVFIFRVLKNEKVSVLPSGYDGQKSIISSSACQKNQYGIYCANKIIKDGWQIKDDYPW